MGEIFKITRIRAGRFGCTNRRFRPTQQSRAETARLTAGGSRLNRYSLLLLILLTACSDAAPSPADCRRHGVAVQDSDPITGKIMAEYYEDAATVAAKCKGAKGCARAVGFRDYVFITPKGEYEIWYSDQSLRTHEQCHALFEATEHTK